VNKEEETKKGFQNSRRRGGGGHEEINFKRGGLIEYKKDEKSINRKNVFNAQCKRKERD